MIALLLLIDQSLFNLLIVSQSIHNQTGTQMRHVGFQTNDSILDKIDYNKYISKEAT
jgi:hypothetical protein